MNTQTPDPATVLEQLEILGRKHAVSHFEKGNFLDSPNEEVQKWLDRHQFTPIQKEFDRMYDAYCKGFQSYHIEKWIAGLDQKEAADLRQRLASTVSCHAEGLLGGPEAIHPPQGGNPSFVTDVLPHERLLTEAHDAMMEAENALTEFCGHNDETRGGWALQSLTRSIENIRSMQRIAVEGSFALTPPDDTQETAGASSAADRHSDPSSLFNRMAAALRASSLELDHFLSVGEPTKSFAHLETLILGLGELVAELNRLPSPPSTEKPVVQPIKNDSARLLEECRGVLQSVQDATEYETVLEGFEQDSGEFRHQLDLKQSELERLRNLLTKLNA
jgi:hypothetical protein